MTTTARNAHWYKSDTDAVEVINHFLMDSQTCSTGEHMLVSQTWPRTSDGVHSPQNKSTSIILLN